MPERFSEQILWSPEQVAQCKLPNSLFLWVSEISALMHTLAMVLMRSVNTLVDFQALVDDCVFFYSHSWIPKWSQTELLK